jgi:hypothetical protein
VVFPILSRRTYESSLQVAQSLRVLQTMKTKREVFDIVKNHLLTQNKRSVDEYGRCMYRAPDGSKCAIGCLIPDERYKPELEKLAAYSNEVLASLEGVLSDEESGWGMFLNSLQSVHDNYHVHDWSRQLAKIEIPL